MGDNRCPHDGGYCHHECGLDDECFRESGGMRFTEPVKGYPKCNVRISNRYDPNARCIRRQKAGSRYCWQHAEKAERELGEAMEWRACVEACAERSGNMKLSKAIERANDAIRESDEEKS